MAGYVIDSAHIVRILAKDGHCHRCARCDTPMLVKGESSLCVHCYNDLRSGECEGAEDASEADPADLAPASA